MQKSKMNFNLNRPGKPARLKSKDWNYKFWRWEDWNCMFSISKRILLAVRYREKLWLEKEESCAKSHETKLKKYVKMFWIKILVKNVFYQD